MMDDVENGKIGVCIMKDKKSRMNAASFLRLVRKYTDIQELTPLVLHEMVEKIVVHQAQGTGKNRIMLVWRGKTIQIRTVFCC